MSHVGRKTFDRNETSSCDFRSWNLAGAKRFPVFQNCARAAHADAATELRPRQAKSIAQDPKQRRVIINIDIVRNAVDRDAKFAHRDNETSLSIFKDNLVADNVHHTMRP
jgi:hypothetical protein